MNTKKKTDAKNSLAESALDLQRQKTAALGATVRDSDEEKPKRQTPQNRVNKRSKNTEKFLAKFGEKAKEVSDAKRSAPDSPEW